MSDETFDVWPHDPTQIVKEALREYVGDGDGEDERVLAAHEERVRAEERERIAREAEKAWQDGSWALTRGTADWIRAREGACPHCPDGHAQPESRPWAVFVASEVDGDGQPTHLYVVPTAGQHVAESDAEWVRTRLNAAEETR